MYRYIPFCFLLAVMVSINAQTVNLRGTVQNQAGKPIANAIVELVKQKLKDTTGADGAYSIISGTGVQLPLLLPDSRFISQSNGFVVFSLPEPSPVKVEIFDTKGNLLQREVQQKAATGFYRFKIEETARTRASKLLIIKASIGQEQVTLRYFPVHDSKYTVSNAHESGLRVERNSFIKLAAVNDTLRTAAPNYKTQVTAVKSYDQLINITLDTAAGTMPSAGCGKEPPFSGEKRITINVTAAGTGNRDYILRLPGDYDKNHPYPLFFAVHCMSGSADNVAHSEPDTKAQYEYLGLWKFANPAGGKGTTIFCAPEGISAAWGQGQKDVEFFRAMIRKFESELCIDQSRIFSIGFSMGGSMSYALACAMPDTMRAIGMLSGGGMSGCDGAHRGPVPIFITHGTQDGRCTWPGSGYPQIKDLAARDECDPIDIPSQVQQNPPADQMHPVCFEYKNCKPGFPCRACIFKGDHIGSPGTQGSYGKNNTWTDDSAWSYFKRFY